jgi:hypothetical protein
MLLQLTEFPRSARTSNPFRLAVDSGDGGGARRIGRIVRSRSRRLHHDASNAMPTPPTSFGHALTELTVIKIC